MASWSILGPGLLDGRFSPMGLSGGYPGAVASSQRLLLGLRGPSSLSGATLRQAACAPRGPAGGCVREGTRLGSGRGGKASVLPEPTAVRTPCAPRGPILWKTRRSLASGVHGLGWAALWGLSTGMWMWAHRLHREGGVSVGSHHGGGELGLH